MSQLSEQIGRVVGGRYRLLAPLGAGASAQVFLAEDVTLQRQVAVKMLQPALAGDQHFLERFRAEAQTVASISHPNVVVVHDSGVDEVPFLVTEYLAGGSLRGMLTAGHRLTPAQALVVGLDTCRGLAHAHGRGLVHRDLKPANLLFGEDARLRIADFGIARALAESGITDHEGHLVGTMRYASPEQARGERAGTKADVYALALVLVEAVTGRVPFAGGDPVAALQARTQGDLVVPESLGALRPAVERAGRLDPEERADAEELGIALLAASERLTAPKPLPLVGALSEAGASGDGERLDERTQLAPAPDETELPAGPAPDGDGSRRRRRWPALLAVILAVAIGAGGFALAEQLRTPSAEVPELARRTIDEVEALATENGWVLDRKPTRRDGTEPGEVVSTDPAAGEDLEEGGTLTVIVSEGNTLTELPSPIRGRPIAEVQAALARVGLEHEVAEAHDEEIPAQHVIRVDGDLDGQIPKGTVIPLLVSLGPQPRLVPDLPDGAGWAEAAEAIGAQRLEAVRTDAFSETVPAGQVISLDPPAGTEVPRDSKVAVTVSKGPERVQVPALGDMSLDEAEAALRSAGLELGQACCAPRGRVVGTDPTAGTYVRKGTAVNLFMAR